MVDVPSNANNATEDWPMENSASYAQEDPSNAIDLYGAEKKHVNGSSSGGKRRKEAHKAIEKFAVCEMVWRSHDHRPLKYHL